MDLNVIMWGHQTAQKSHVSKITNFRNCERRMLVKLNSYKKYSLGIYVKSVNWSESRINVRYNFNLLQLFNLQGRYRHEEIIENTFEVWSFHKFLACSTNLWHDEMKLSFGNRKSDYFKIVWSGHFLLVQIFCNCSKLICGKYCLWNTWVAPSN